MVAMNVVDLAEALEHHETENHLTELGPRQQGRAQAVLDAIPDGWAKWNGEWVQIEERWHEPTDGVCWWLKAEEAS